MVDRQVHGVLDPRRNHHLQDQILVVAPLPDQMLLPAFLLGRQIAEQQLPANRSILLAVRNARMYESSQSLHVDYLVFVQNAINFF